MSLDQMILTVVCCLLAILLRDFVLALCEDIQKGIDKRRNQKWLAQCEREEYPRAFQEWEEDQHDLH